MVVHDNIRLLPRLLEVHRPGVLLARIPTLQHPHPDPNTGCTFSLLVACADLDVHASMPTSIRFLDPFDPKLKLPPL